jgi:vesicle-fusing ATPase
MKVTKSPDDAAARTNRVYLSSQDLPPTTKYVLVEDQFLFNCMVDKQIPMGSIGTTLFHRRYATLSLSQEVGVKAFDPIQEGTPFCASITLTVTRYLINYRHHF